VNPRHPRKKTKGEIWTSASSSASDRVIDPRRARRTEKLLDWFGGPGLDATGQFLAMLGFSAGRRRALMAGLKEAV
jgi:hypothetical protein